MVAVLPIKLSLKELVCINAQYKAKPSSQSSILDYFQQVGGCGWEFELKTHEIARMLGTSNQTISNWIKEFGDFFGPGLKSTKYRDYSEADLLVLATIAKLSHSGLNYKTIRDRLAAGERLESLSAFNSEADAQIVVPVAAVQPFIDATEIRMELENAKHDLEEVRRERDRLRAEIATKDNRIAHLEQKLDTNAEELKALYERITELTDRASRAAAELEMRRKEDEKPRRRWFGG